MKKIGMANTLTLFRIGCVPIFIIFFALEEYGLALAIFCLAGFTDLIDGTVARLRKENSSLGAILDPIADKGLMLSTFTALAVVEVIPWWFIAIILVRDLVVVGGYVFIRAKNIEMELKAILTSKVATFMEITTGILALIFLTFPTVMIWVYPIGDLLYGSVLITSALILIATMHYLKVGMDLIDGGERKRSNA